MKFARKVSDRVVFVHAGRIHESGSPEAVFGNPHTPGTQAVPVRAALTARSASVLADGGGRAYLVLPPSYFISMDTTKLSAKGQVVLPKRVRDARGWAPGVEFVVENTEAGVLLRPKLQGKSGRIADAAGMLKQPGRKPASLKDMDAAIAAEVRARHARGRY